ncbi:MAG: hypothetical protein H6828_11800, partial [Planctomycetes bacterium]|nr:hypothetical protein [Planctomycetota bacterium]
MPSPAKALVPALLLAACAAPRAEEPSPPAPEGAPQVELDARARLKQAVDAGDFEAARALATQLLVESRLAWSRAALAGGDLDGSWKALARALEL